MVNVQIVKEIRPRIADEFSPEKFIPRTPAIARAFEWGRKLHTGQLRLNGDPYFETHCGWVAGFLDRLVGNEAWTIAGLLHDSVEDTGESLDQIRDLFPGFLGDEVAHIVDGVTKISNPRHGRSRELETLQKIAMFRDPGVFLVKLADKSHNLLTLQFMPRNKRVQKATEALRAYAKLAGILNCYRWRRWIEDMAFPYAEPETYSFVREKIDSDPRLDLNFINSMLCDLGEVMEKTGIDGRVEITVNGYWQSWSKLRSMARARKTSMSSFAALNDLVSFRMITSENDENNCYVLLAAVNRHLGKLLDQDRFDDYIACPQNGYRAIQVTSWLPGKGAVEVAIATDDMEGENAWGIVHSIQHQKDISSYRPVTIFTPTGGTRFVTDGSTVLDAVAAIQQEFLLDKISAVEVNGGLTRLSDQVHPGDIVEVITGGERLVPTEEWLEFSDRTTSKAVRSVLATLALRKAAEEGKGQIASILRDRGLLALEDLLVLQGNKVDHVLARLACANLEDLYSAVGSGAIRLVDVECALDEMKIAKADLGWTTIRLYGNKVTNRPGVLAKLAGLVSVAGGNIVRSVNETQMDGGFSLRLVILNLSKDELSQLRKSFEMSGIIFDDLEMV